jgi:hypothetical protein
MSDLDELAAAARGATKATHGVSTPEKIWHVFDRGKQDGPFREAEVRSLIKQGAFGPDAQVLREGGEEWRPMFPKRTTVAAPSPPPTQARKPKARKWVWIVGILAVLWVIGTLVPKRAPAPPDPEAAARRAEIDDRLTANRTGARSVLRTPGNKAMLVAIDEQSRDRAIQLQRADDRRGLGELVLAGRIFRVESGAKAIVIDPGILTTEIRLLDGPHAGKAGLIDAEFIKPQ